jgi:hypothetical protein
VDNFALDSAFDYDPVWRRCVELGIAPAFHSSGMGWGNRSSLTSYVYNHLGNFSVAGESTCRSLFLGGVSHRFPELRCAFLEGGVAWACSLYADLIGHFEKRGPARLPRLDPARLDRAQMARLFEQYAPASFLRHLPRLDAALAILSDPDEDRDQLDEFAASGVRRPEDIRDVFSRSFYFGCEADDAFAARAFDTATNPLGARLRPVFGSDIGHWDVPDMLGVLPEAWEQVERGFMSEEELRDFLFTNPARLWGEANPDYFKGTRVEAAAEKVLAAS